MDLVIIVQIRCVELSNHSPTFQLQRIWLENSKIEREQLRSYWGAVDRTTRGGKDGNDICDEDIFGRGKETDVHINYLDCGDMTHTETLFRIAAKSILSRLVMVREQ